MRGLSRQARPGRRELRGSESRPCLAIPLRLYRPLGAAPGLAAGPGLSSTAAAGCSATSRRSITFAGRLANASGCAVVSVDYRLSPRVQSSPGALEDCFEASQFQHRPSRGLGDRSPERIAVGGDSAGGNLAAREEGFVRTSSDSAVEEGYRRCDLTIKDVKHLAFQLLIYPITDLLVRHAFLLRERRGLRAEPRHDEVVLGPVPRPARGRDVAAGLATSEGRIRRLRPAAGPGDHRRLRRPPRRRARLTPEAPGGRRPGRVEALSGYDPRVPPDGRQLRPGKAAIRRGRPGLPIPR